MQTFLPYWSYYHSARALDNARLGKQRVEAKQIVEINRIGPFQKAVDYIYRESGKPIVFEWAPVSAEEITRNPGLIVRQTPWYNHPAVRMWREWEEGLLFYGRRMCEEWIRRGFNDTLLPFFQRRDEDIQASTLHPSWISNALCRSHQSNLLRKDYSFYSKVFGENIETDLPYLWPV